MNVYLPEMADYGVSERVFALSKMPLIRPGATNLDLQPAIAGWYNVRAVGWGTGMKLSDKALSFLEAWEGIELEVYQDQGGKPTIGIGHLLTPQELASGIIEIGHQSVLWSEGLTAIEARALKAKDAARFEKAVNSLNFELKQHEFDALVILAFNIGVKAFAGSSVVSRLIYVSREFAIEAWPWWNKVGGKVSTGLVKRREAEIAMFSDADYSKRP